MNPFITHTGKIAVLDRANVDTDQIIPKQFLKSIQRTGFGHALFFDWRYGSDGKPDPSFILNQPRFEGADILVVGNNFGCGSSREHAVWAVVQDGYKVLIAPRVQRGDEVIPGFADIFANNCVKNGLLTIELSEECVQHLFDAVAAEEGLTATVDLEAQTLTLHAEGDAETMRFDVDPAVKNILLNGLDDITTTLQSEADITAFEAVHKFQMA